MDNARLVGIRETDLNADQRPLWDAITSGPRGAAPWMVADGVLAGPFNAWLHVPDLGSHLAAAGERLRFGSLLDPIIRELVILTVGAHWKSEFEFWAHSGIGRTAGMTETLIEAIATGDTSAVTAETGEVGRAAHRFTLSMLTDGHPSTNEVSALRSLLGDPASVELVVLAGYYCTVSFTLNSFDVELPRGVEPRWTQH
jgi:4-carboxymuconolactone decarboxylase